MGEGRDRMHGRAGVNYQAHAEGANTDGIMPLTWVGGRVVVGWWKGGGWRAHAPTKPPMADMTAALGEASAADGSPAR